ncbi:MAG: alpha/beta fold hydrolase [Actinomycetota bacterium]|nr:alpha/beta fold hydrolase [Actinomycetota bacterium]
MTAATNLETRRAGSVEYHVGGSGEPLLLLHGLAGSTDNWVELVPDLVAHYRVIAVDLPGHARSAPLGRGATMEDFAASAAAVLDAEGVSRAVVAGHSFGGLVGLRLARTRPELVRALLLISPAGIATTTRAAQAVVLTTATIRPGRAASRFRHRCAERAWYRRALFRPWFVADADVLSASATHGLLSAQALHADTKVASRAMLSDDPRAHLAEISCPTLVLWGAQDRQLPLEDAFEYARRLDAKLRLVADCGHLVIVERPAAVLDALAEVAA